MELRTLVETKGFNTLSKKRSGIPRSRAIRWDGMEQAFQISESPCKRGRVERNLMRASTS